MKKMHPSSFSTEDAVVVNRPRRSVTDETSGGSGDWLFARDAGGRSPGKLTGIPNDGSTVVGEAGVG